MEQLENRNNVRISNQIQILNLLRQKKMTVTDLAAALDISFTAASHIIQEMIDEELIASVSKKKPINQRGRIPYYVEMNNDKGVVCGIDFSNRNVEIIISTLDCKIVAIDTLSDALFIEYKHLEEIEKKIKAMLLLPEVKGRKLLSICIASPGLIRPDKFEYVCVYRVKNFDKLNPVLYFANAFNVKVEMYNDVRTACLGELKFGAFPKFPFNGFYVEIGSGAGISIIFNGKIYRGTNGFSGEIPCYNDELDPFIKENTYSGRIVGFLEILNRLKFLKGEPKPSPDDAINEEKIVYDYKNGDPLTRQVVEENYKHNAITLISLCTYLDVEYIVIGGSILNFGNEYLENLRKYINEYSHNELRARIVASTTDGKSSRYGVCYQAVSSYLFDALEIAARKRINNPSFTINNVFKEM